MNDAAGSVTQEAKTIKDGLVVRQTQLAKESATAAHSTSQFVTALGAGGIMFGALLAWMLGRGISRPMIGMCKAMRELATGNFDVVLPGLGRKDEIALAQAVDLVRVDFCLHTAPAQRQIRVVSFGLGDLTGAIHEIERGPEVREHERAPQVVFFHHVPLWQLPCQTGEHVAL